MELPNVKFLPVQPPEELFQMLAVADLCLITQQRVVADIVFPSRTVTFMAAGCPIVASLNADSAVASILQRSGAGLVVAPEDPVRLFDAVATLQSNASRRDEMSQAGRRFAHENWDENVIFPKMESELLRLARPDSGKDVEKIPVLDLERGTQ
jgi:glycosyltransferase involved in cell wall biosynthesis